MSACSRCGATFTCALADGGSPEQPCWCTTLPTVMPVPTDVVSACYCPDCLRLISQAQAEPG